jgi:hypothetical protein
LEYDRYPLQQIKQQGALTMNSINLGIIPTHETLVKIQRSLSDIVKNPINPTEAYAFYSWVHQQEKFTLLKNPKADPNQPFTKDRPLVVYFTHIFPNKPNSRRLKIGCSCRWWDHEKDQLGDEFIVQAFCYLGPYEKWPHSWQISSIGSIIEAEN